MKKLVINTCFNRGFYLPPKFCEKYDLDWFDDIERDDKRLVEWLEERGGEWEEKDLMLRLVFLQDNTTDYIINENSGLEEVIYVIDGKIHTITYF